MAARPLFNSPVRSSRPEVDDTPMRTPEHRTNTEESRIRVTGRLTPLAPARQSLHRRPWSAGPRMTRGGGRTLHFDRPEMDELSKRFDELHSDPLSLPPSSSTASAFLRSKLPVVDELAPAMANRTLQRFSSCRSHLIDALRDATDSERREFAIQAVDQILAFAHTNPSSELLVHKLQEYQLQDVQQFTIPLSSRRAMEDVKQA